MVGRLAASLVRDPADALPDARPVGWLDGTARTFFGVEGCRAAGAAPGGGDPAAAEPQAEAGLGGPGGARRLGPAAARSAAGEPTGEAGDAVALAPSAGPLAVDLSPPRRSAARPAAARSAGTLIPMAPTPVTPSASKV